MAPITPTALALGYQTSTNHTAENEKSGSVDEEKGVEMAIAQELPAADGEQEEAPLGLMKLRAVTDILGQRGIWLLWIGLGLSYFTFEFDNVCVYQYLPYATSSFSDHSMLSAITVAGSVVSSVAKVPFGKLSDVLGRGEVYVICLLCYELGYILMSTSPTIGVYAGGYVLYNAGQTGTQIMNVIIIADITSQRWRSLATGAVYISYIICVWISSYTVSSMLAHSTWRWGVRMMIFVMPAGMLTIIFTFLNTERRARIKGTIPRRKVVLSELPMDIYTFFSQVDLGGMILLAGGCAFILVSCALAADLSNGWKTPAIIACLVLGFVFLVALPIYEKRVAKHPLVPVFFFKNKTIMVCAVAVFLDALGAAISSTYMYSWMLVTQGWATQDLTYFNYANWQVQTLFGIFAGAYMWYFRRYKWLTVAGQAVRIIGFGIQFAYRSPQQNRGLLVMVQVIQGIGSGVCTQNLPTIAQFEVTHAYLASNIAFLLLSSFIGSSIGDSIAGAIWTNYLPGLLRKHLPNEPESVIEEIYGNITDLPAFGTTIRTGMNDAYMDIMRKLTIVTLAISFVPLLLCLWLPDKRLSDTHNIVEDQTKEEAQVAEVSVVVPTMVNGMPSMAPEAVKS